MSEATIASPLITTVLVVRHAEVHNPRDIVYGRLPRFRLSTHGRQQAERTARFLASWNLTAVFTSPLLRARQSASLFTHYHPTLKPRIAKDLIEVRTSYEGSPNTILKPGFSFYEPQRDPNDETMQEVFDRMWGFVHGLAKRHLGGTVVCVSHADPITILRVGLEGRPMDSENLHATVYAERSSVTQITMGSGGGMRLAYFDVATDPLRAARSA